MSCHPATRKYRITLLVIAVTAVVIRLLHIYSIIYRPISDMDAYLKFSQAIGYNSPDLIYTTLFPPGYTWFLWLFQKFAAIATPQPVLALQALLSGGSLLMVASIARITYGARTAIVTASVYAIYKSSVLFTGLLQSETLAECFFVAGILLLVSYAKHRRFWKIIVCSAVISLAVHTRVNLISAALSLPVAMLWLAWKSNGSRINIITHTGIYLAVLGISLVPWCLRNTSIHGYPTFISSNGGMNLLQGNNAYTEGGWFRIQDIADSKVQQIGAAEFKERARLYKDSATDFIKSHPAYEIFYLIPQRFHHIFLEDQVFWPWEQAIESNYASHPFGPWINIPLLSFGAIFMVGIIGLMIPGNARLSYFLPLLWLAILAPLLLVHGNARFHYGSDFILVISSSALIVRTIPTKRQRCILIIAWATVALASILSVAIQFLRFGGNNMLNPSKAVLLSQLGEEAVLRTAVVDSQAHPIEQKITDLFELPVNAKTTSHLLLSAEFSLSTYRPQIASPNIQVTFFNNSGSTVTAPRHATELLPPNVNLNPNVGFEQAWRMILVPASAKTLRLAFDPSYPASVSFRNLRLNGPIWE